MIWKLLPQILGAALIALVAVLDYHWFDKRTRRFRLARKCLFGLCFAAMVVSIVAVLKEDKESVAEKEALRSRLDDLTGLQKIATSNATQQLKLEEETKLHPELECAYNPYDEVFVIRNAGNAPATMIYLRTTVVCVTSNEVFVPQAFNLGQGSFFPPLHPKTSLLPGEQANAAKLLAPHVEMLMEVWKRFGDDVLIRVFVEYERPAPPYHRYSGYFNFLYDVVGQRLSTEQEKPWTRTVVDRFDSMPRARRHPALHRGKSATNQWDVWSDWTLGTEDGATMTGASGSNAVSIIREGWAKHR